MRDKLPNWKLIEEAARELAKASPDGTFTRRDITRYINEVLLKGHPPRKESSLNPMIQAVTANVPGGAPGGIGKNILYRVRRGIYRLFNPHTDKPIPEKGGEVFPISSCMVTVEPDGSLKIPGRFVRSLGLKPYAKAICHIKDDRLIVEPILSLRELLMEKPKVRINLEEFLLHRRELSKRLES